MEQEKVDSQALQERLYFILDKLQTMARDLPSKHQQRLPMELLSGLANTLLHDTVFEIVKGLKDIQDVTEKVYFQQRLTLLNNQRTERLLLRESKISMNKTEEDEEDEELILRQKNELKDSDIKVLMAMDQKCAEQQAMMEKAGVPGFYVTNNPDEIQTQMYLIEFILKISKLPLPSVSSEAL